MSKLGNWGCCFTLGNSLIQRKRVTIASFFDKRNKNAQHSTAQHSTAQHSNFTKKCVTRALSLLGSALLISGAAQAAPELITGTTFKLDIAPAAVQATGRQMTVSGLQLTDATGSSAYYDATFEFGVLADGNVGLRLTSASPSTFAAQTKPFVAGNYSDPVGNIYAVTGPTQTATNRLEYSVRLTTVTSTAGKQQGFEATWQTGVTSGNPILGDRVNTMPNMGTSDAFGVVTNNVNYFSPSGDSSTWYPGGNESVMGATQTSPTTLKLNYYNTYKTPYRSVTLTKI